MAQVMIHADDVVGQATPAWKAVLGVLAWPDIASLPFTPDLAVLCTNASRNLALLEELGEKGCKTTPPLPADSSPLR